MKYGKLKKGIFLERPNRFIAWVELDGRREKVHVKNTGRCRELLQKGAEVYLERSANPNRSTAYDLVAVKKGDRLVNMDSVAPNKAAEEWLASGGLYENVRLLRRECTYGNSRFDFYLRTEEKEIWIEVKGVNLERDNVALFPDAPSARALKHVEELIEAKAAGCEAVVLFVVQMEGIRLFAPNRETQPGFADALMRAERAGVRILAYSCRVTEEGMEIAYPIPVELKPLPEMKSDAPAELSDASKSSAAAMSSALPESPAAAKPSDASKSSVPPEPPAASKPSVLPEPAAVAKSSAPADASKSDLSPAAGRLENIAPGLLSWYDTNRRILPWREDPSPYRVWVSEIMLQQTRVEAVKPYFERFLESFPDVASLAGAADDRLLKLWEGLGYYNRAHNLKKAAQAVMERFEGKMPSGTEELMSLPGIGSYTAGAISSIAYGYAVPAVDGNVLRVISRFRADGRDMSNARIRKSVEEDLAAVIPAKRPGDFNQALMELGAVVCLPNGAPKCGECPLEKLCLAHIQGRELDFPQKAAKKKRAVEERTVLVIRDDKKAAIRRRPEGGLLSGMYEFPSLEGHLSPDEVLAFLKEKGLKTIRISPLPDSKHIFSHKEWHMTGYAVRVDELEPHDGAWEELLFVEPSQTEERYPIPAAYAAYTKYLKIRLGNEKYTRREE